MSERAEHPLASRLRAVATLQSAAGNETFELQPAEQVWFVDEGSVEVFVTRDGGRRHHLGTAGAGQLLFGFAAAADLTLLAAGSQGTRLLHLGRNELQALARDPELLPELTAAVDGWLSWLQRALPHPPGLPGAGRGQRAGAGGRAGSAPLTRRGVVPPARRPLPLPG